MKETDDPRKAILAELQAILDGDLSSPPDKLKAIAIMTDLLGLKTQPSSGDGPAAYDVACNEAMADPAIRKRVEKLDADIQKTLERGRR